ncbi:hypothetical protein A0U40_09735 [[Bacillus] sp. KCTC 13219]|nr:hypothetical protein A0U40_09735 [[Bacillus] sp. KCTC 13219]
MLEIRNKKMVTTRKVHECYGCENHIEKGVQAVYVTAKQDDKHQNFHLHQSCNVVIKKRNLDIYKGCLKGKEGCYVCVKEIPEGINIFTVRQYGKIHFCSEECKKFEEKLPF